MSKENNKVYTNLVLSGGGLKGLCTLGALSILDNKDMLKTITTYCGSSAGAILCLFLNIGYTPKDIFDILYEIDFSMLTSFDFDCLFDDVCIGLDKGDAIKYVIGTLMIKKNYSINTTFDELYEKTKKKLIITGTCVNNATIKYFSYETTPKMKIMTAIRITYSIPIVFKPVKHENNLWIDGGCMDNYPIELFKNELDKTIGILVNDEIEIESFDDITQYFVNIIKCLQKGLIMKSYDQYKNNTIYINSLASHNNMDFVTDNNGKLQLYELGKEKATGFFTSNQELSIQNIDK